ncbi:MAG TPA: MFS transporter [Candidatus Angelobacter sp.]|nr:MFS transporter [Candidatus Angelobacter sp.]
MKIRSNLSLFAVIAEGLLSRLSFGLIGFALPLYARHLGLSFTQIGILVSLNSAVALCLKPLLGWVGDRFGLKRTFLSSIAMRSLVSLLLAFAAGPWALYAIRSLYGVSMSLRDPSANGLIAEHGGKKSVASAFAWYQTARQVANSVSKALAGVLLAMTASNYATVFYVAFALSLLPIVLVLLLVHEPPAHQPLPVSEATASPSAAGQPKRKISVLPFVGFGFLVAGTAEMLSGLFPVIATEYAHLTKAQAGLIYTISTMIAIVSGPVFGWLADNVSRKLTLLLRSVANTLSSALYLIWPTYAGVGVARSIDDMGKAAFRPAWGALMAQISGADRSRRARTMSWLSMGEDAGGVAAPMLAGFLWNTWGIAALMSARIVLALVTEAYALFIERHQYAGKKQTGNERLPDQLREVASVPEA